LEAWSCARPACVGQEGMPPAEATENTGIMSLESLGASWAMDVAGVIKAVGSPEKRKIDDKSAIPELIRLSPVTAPQKPASTPTKVVSKSSPPATATPNTPTMPPRPSAPPVEKLEPVKMAQNAKKHAAAPSTGAGGSQKTAPVVSSAKTGAKGSSAFKTLVTTAAVLILIALGVLLLVYKSPNSGMAGTVQTCASQLGVDIKDVGKKMTEMGKKVGQSVEAAQKNAAKGALAFLGESHSEHKQDLMTSEQQGGLVQSIGYAAGAAVTSTVGYGLYWLLTQGD
jgi:hypothetical protein